MAIKKKKNTTKKSTLKKVVKKPAKQNKAKKSVKKVTQKAVKKAVKKVAKKTVKKAAKKIVKKAVKQPVKQVVTQPVKQAVKQPVKQPVKQQPAKKVKLSVEIQPRVTMRPVMKQESSNVMIDEIVPVQIAPRKKATTLLGALEFTPYQPKETEDYMSDHQRDHFRKILDAWKQQLMRDVDLTVGHLKEEAVFYADPVDRASQEEGFNLELRTRDRERRLIKKIEQSLDLLNTGEYGFCEDCGAEIGIRRLEARPTAVKCIDCKTFQEIREKQLGG